MSAASRSSATTVAAVIVNYNGLDRTLRCLASLAAQSHAPSSIVVVDNGSSDGSAAALTRAYPEIDQIVSPTNLGFAAGANLGIRRALTFGVGHVWLLNNDARAGPDALAELLAVAADDARVGAVASVLERDDGNGSIEAWGGGRVSLLLGVSRLAVSPRDARRLDFLSGASLLVRATALADVGLLDERFFLYFEDVDLCFRLRRRAWRLAVAPRSRVVHEGGASAGYLSARWDRQYVFASALFFRKHAPLPVLPTVLGALVRCALRLRRGHLRNLPAIAAGVVRGLHDLPDPASPTGQPSR